MAGKSERIHIKTVIGVVLAGLCMLPLSAMAEDSDAWSYSVTPYLWAIGMSGQTGPKGFEANVDMNFGDVLDNLDGAIIINMEASKGSWTYWLDYNRMNLVNETEVLGGPSSITLELTQKLWEMVAAYQLGNSEGLQVFGGIRSVDVETLIHFQSNGPVGIDYRVRIGDSWVDPIVGIRGAWPLSGKWGFRARADVGGFGVGSDFSYQLAATVSYQFNDLTSLRFGYRYLDMDYDDNNFVLDMGVSGLMLGVGFDF
ncbi:MAG: porin family protein [Xanthomonadales bacterium]|nr:porin family protein [Xanthomonadales bacterium]